MQPKNVQSPTFSWREEGEGPVAVFFHGLGGSRLAWEPQLRGLSGERRIVAWDAPGYGESEPVSEYAFNAYVNAAREFIDSVSPGEPVDLVGMSFGGMIAQYAAAAYPDRIRSLTLMCTSPKFGLDGTDPDEWRAARLSGLESIDKPIDMAEALLTALIAPENISVLPEAKAAMERVHKQGLLDSLSTIVHHDSRTLLPNIAIPTLVLVGDLDDETPPAYSQAIVDLMPNARLDVVQHARHVLNLEAPSAVNTAISKHWNATYSMKEKS
jgi:3-oxoadipate enol-lactonase